MVAWHGMSNLSYAKVASGFSSPELIWAKFKMTLAEFNETSTGFYDTAEAALEAGQTRAAARLYQNNEPPTEADKHLGDINGMSSCLEITPDQGDPVPLVTTEAVAGKFRYKISIPGGEVKYKITFWK